MNELDTIKFNYRQANNLTQTVRQAAQDLRRLSNVQMQENMAFITQSWKGDNANNFLRKEARVANNLLDLARKLEQLADSISASAKQMYDAEMKALEKAKSEESGK